MELRFYDVGRGRLARVLHKMLEKTLSRGERAVVRFQSQSRAAELDAYLWNEPLDGFLPHALADERLYASAESSSLQAEQPIILTTGVEVINEARALFHWQEGGDVELASKFPIRAEGIFDLCCFLFSSGDGSEAVAQELWERAITLSAGALSSDASPASDTESGMGDISVNFWVDSGGAWIKRDAKHGGVKDETVEKKVEEKVKDSLDSVSPDSVSDAPNNASNNADSPAATAASLSRKQESLL